VIEMPKLLVTTLEGIETAVEGEVGLSVMENIRRNGFDDLLALCGGSCSCATCHVYVDPAWLGALAPMSATENELLSLSEHRQSSSRLSCQITFNEKLDGFKVRIAPVD